MGAQLNGRELILMAGCGAAGVYMYRIFALPTRWSLGWKLF